MAHQLLAERGGHAAGGTGALAASRHQRPADQARRLARPRPARVFHGDAGPRAARLGRRRVPIRRPRSFRWCWRRSLSPRCSGWNPPSSAAARFRPVSQPKLCARLHAGVPPHARYHGPPPLLQPLRAGAGWARQDARRGGPFAHAALRRAVRLRAGGASARGRDRYEADDGGRIAAAGARLRDRLGVARRSGFRGVDG